MRRGAWQSASDAGGGDDEAHRTRSASRLLPRGGLLDDEAWARRHRGISRFALVQSTVLSLLTWIILGPRPAAMVAALLVAPLAPAGWSRLSRTARAVAVTTSLTSTSAVLVHLCAGRTEAHFHFFVMVGVVALYEEWSAFAVALVIVVFHHGVLGTLRPEDVFGAHVHGKAWSWAAVHGAFVFAAALTHLISWRLVEDGSFFDGLTDLANASWFGHRLDAALSRDDTPITVVVLDIDRLGAVNELAGTSAGDALLRTVAGRLRAAAPYGTPVARIGPDEFALLLHGDARAAADLTRGLLERLSEPVGVGVRDLPVTMCAGLAEHSTGLRAASAEELLGFAIAALQDSKGRGRGQITSSTGERRLAAIDRAELAADLRAAIAANELSVAYQPVVRAADRTLVGVEALVRWTHPTRGPVPPSSFIPIAEHEGLIDQIGRFVLTTALEQGATWRRHGRDLHVAVNVSPLQLERDGLVEEVRALLHRTGLPASLLTIEITEGVLVNDDPRVHAALRALRASGSLISIDDFGTGYSSLSYLDRLPVDALKIDRSFVTRLKAGEPTLITTLLELARSRNLTVVAEGVETDEQADILAALGCLYLQGYRFGKPGPPELIEADLAAHSR